MKWCLLLLAAVPAWPADSPTAFDFVPPGARVIFGMRVRGVVDSTLARSLSSEIQGATADWQKFISLAGFDPLHDLDELLLASTGEGKQAPVLIVARGRFDAARLGAKGKPYHGVPLVSEKDASVLAIVDESTVLAGDLAEVKAAIDRRGSPAALDSALAARIADYRERYEIWGVADHPAGLAKRLAGSSEGPQSLDSIDRFQFGLGLSHGLEIAAEVHARSAKEAEQLTSSLRLLEAMFKAQPSAPAGTKLNIESDAGTLKIALAISEEELKKAIEKQRQTAQATRPAPTQSKPGLQTSDGGTTVLTLPSAK